jgi:hypothetical protein
MMDDGDTEHTALPNVTNDLILRPLQLEIADLGGRSLSCVSTNWFN